MSLLSTLMYNIENEKNIIPEFINTYTQCVLQTLYNIYIERYTLYKFYIHICSILIYTIYIYIYIYIFMVKLHK